MKKHLVLAVILLFITLSVSYSQTTNPDKKFGITFKGFVKTDFIYDSRQIENFRENHFSLLPKPADYDKNNDGVNDVTKDLNAQSNINFLSIQSRLSGIISGPDFFGMQTSGMLEGAFFGNSDASTGEFRLRHAYVQLSNDKIDIILGQYWSPMFIMACFPEVYSFNTGVPFHPFSRNPQIRITTKGNIRLMGSLYTERDFKTRGASVSQSGLPQFHAQIQAGKTSATLGGIGLNVKTSRPALGEDNLTSSAAIAYFRTKLGEVSWKTFVNYGQNMTDVLQIGGFGKNVNGEYINSKTLSMWSELNGNITEHIEWGLFGGYTENGGFGENVTLVDGFLWNVDYAYRVAPRIGWKSGALTLGLEGEYTKAQYGDTFDGSGDLFSSKNEDPVSNFRLLTTAIYSF